MAGSDVVMAAVLGSFPRLLGYKDEDPTYEMVRNEFITRLNPQCSGELSDLDMAEAALKAAGEEVEGLVKEISPDWQAAENADEGRTEWKGLTVAEKSEAVASGQSIGDLMKSGAIRVLDDEDEDRTPWAGMTTAEKVKAVEERGDRNVVELVRKGV